MAALRMKSWRTHPVLAEAEPAQQPEQAEPRPDPRLPAKGRFAAIRTDHYHYVIDHRGEPVSKAFCAAKDAQALAANMNREAERAVRLGSRGPRQCMCCGRTFASEGIQNRMCGTCRTSGLHMSHW